MTEEKMLICSECGTEYEDIPKNWYKYQKHFPRCPRCHLIDGRSVDEYED